MTAKRTSSSSSSSLAVGLRIKCARLVRITFTRRGQLRKKGVKRRYGTPAKPAKTARKAQALNDNRHSTSVFVLLMQLGLFLFRFPCLALYTALNPIFNLPTLLPHTHLKLVLSLPRRVLAILPHVQAPRALLLLLRQHPIPALDRLPLPSLLPLPPPLLHPFSLRHPHTRHCSSSASFLRQGTRHAIRVFKGQA